jgi:AraC-like DNA-binding protein
VVVRAIERLIEIGVGVGIRRDILLEAAGVSERDLLDPDARLPVSAAVALWQTLATYTADPTLGVRAGAALHVRQVGLVGYLAWFSGTLGAALRRIERYGPLLTQEMAFTLQDDRRALTLTIRRLAGSDLWVSQDFTLAAALQFSRELTSVEIVPIEVSFTYPTPTSTVAHRQHFRCPLRFDAPVARMVLRASESALPIVRADETLAGYLTRYAEQVLASLVHGGTTRHAVRAAVWSLLGDGRPSLRQVAAVLAVPPRTMQRRLAAEDTSLHNEIEEIRKTMALAILRDRSVSIAEVSALLGYAEPSAFFRSFKRWMGTTPDQFRRASA